MKEDELEPLNQNDNMNNSNNNNFKFKSKQNEDSIESNNVCINNNNEPNNIESNKTYIDSLVENLGFKNHHAAIFIMSLGCFISKGYIVIHFFYCVTFYYEQFVWDNNDISNLVIIYFLFVSAGNFFSQNNHTKDWNVVSHGILSLVILLSFALTIIVRQSFVYSIDLIIFGFCLGFIEVATISNLVDSLDISKRRLYFLICSSGYIIGCSYSGIIIWIMESLGVKNPSWYLFGLLLLWLVIPLCTLFIEESPRVLYYLNSSFELAENIIKIKNLEKDDTYKAIVELNKLHKEIEISKERSISNRPRYYSMFSGYNYLFKEYQRTHSSLSILIIFIQSIMLIIIRGLEPALIAIGEDNYTVSFYNGKGWKMFVTFTCDIIVFSLLVVLFTTLGKWRGILFTFALHSISLVFVILFIIFKGGYIYFVCGVETLVSFNIYCVYLNNLEKTLSVSRNALYSLMSISSNIAFILVFSMRNYILQEMLLAGVAIFCILTLISFYLEYVIFDESSKAKDIGRNELEILRLIPKSNEEYEGKDN